jgi:hypothetical protein
MRVSDSIIRRMIRAARLESSLYEEVEADNTATTQALLVVALVSVATGIGSGVAAIGEQGALGFVWGLLVGIIASILGWLILSFLVYLVGTTFLKGEATRSSWGECLRTIGFANSPGVLRLFSLIPFLGGFISFVVFIWILIASIIAIRQALDISTGRAIVVGIIGVIIYAVIYFVGSLIFLGAGALF